MNYLPGFSLMTAALTNVTATKRMKTASRAILSSRLELEPGGFRESLSGISSGVAMDAVALRCLARFYTQLRQILN